MHIMLGAAFQCAYLTLLYIKPSPQSGEPSNTPCVCVLRLPKVISERDSQQGPHLRSSQVYRPFAFF